MVSGPRSHPFQLPHQPEATDRATASNRLGILAVMIAAFVVVAPILVLGNAFGADFVFHLSSWRDVAQQWHQGVLYPRWYPLITPNGLSFATFLAMPAPWQTSTTVLTSL